MHPVRRLLRDAADGRFPPLDGARRRAPPWRPRVSAVLAFTRHAVFAVDDRVSDDALAAVGANGLASRL